MNSFKDKLREMLEIRGVTFISPIFSVCFYNIDFETDFVFDDYGTSKVDVLRLILLNRDNEYIACIKLTQEQIDSLNFNYDMNYIALN